jgi:hypothetical protein
MKRPRIYYRLLAGLAVVAMAVIYQSFFRYQHFYLNGSLYLVDRLTQNVEVVATPPPAKHSPSHSLSVSPSVSTSTSVKLR